VTGKIPKEKSLRDAPYSLWRFVFIDMKVEIELLGEDKLGLKFSYNASIVARLRCLGNRRWNSRQRRWEVHLSHLPEVIQIFSLTAQTVPAPIRTQYESQWSRRQAVVQLDTLQGKISGGAIPVREIDLQTSFLLPGHKFSPKFKAGQWDGKRHLFQSSTMKFPTGLWSRIQSILDEHGVQYEIERSPVPEAPSIASHTPKTGLRDYQTEALKSALEKGRGILQIATGGGKTLLAAHLIHQLGKRTFFFVHTLDLLYQAAEVFERELGIPIGRLGDGRAEIGDVTVATIQTAARVFGFTTGRERAAKDEDEESRPARERAVSLAGKKEEVIQAIEEAGVVIFDECHHVPADTFYKIAFRTPRAALRFGLSATPWRDDGHDLLLEAALGDKICVVRCTDLIREGYLVAPCIEMVRAPAPRVNRRDWTYHDLYKLAIAENQSRNRVIAAQAKAWAAEGKSVLILVAHVEHGKNLQELLPEANFAYGSLDTETRRQYLHELERKLRPVLIATTLADEGLDVPSLDAVILGGGGKSDTKAYQRIGRALRPSPGKEQALVLDFFDPVPYLQDHSLARLALYRQEPAFAIETKGFRA